MAPSDNAAVVPSGSSLFQRKRVADLIRASEEHQLKRTLGAPSLVALGIGAIIGAGLFSLTGIAAAQYAGPAVGLRFVGAALGCGLPGVWLTRPGTTSPA